MFNKAYSTPPTAPPRPITGRQVVTPEEVRFMAARLWGELRNGTGVKPTEMLIAALEGLADEMERSIIVDKGRM